MRAGRQGRSTGILVAVGTGPYLFADQRESLHQRVIKVLTSLTKGHEQAEELGAGPNAEAGALYEQIKEGG